MKEIKFFICDEFAQELREKIARRNVLFREDVSRMVSCSRAWNDEVDALENRIGQLCCLGFPI